MPSTIASQNAAFLTARETAASTASTTSTTASSSSADASQIQLSSDVNFFLKMLTTQLKNQDPTQPLDTNQFTQQIAQYSGVQQQVNMNLNLEKLLTATKQSGISTAVSYLNREVEVKGSTGEVVGGQGAFSFVLPQAAGSVALTITNASGAVVYTGQGPTAAGRNLVLWDGVNSSTGAREADGIYTLALEAKDTGGKAITAETRAVAMVTGIETDSKGNITLTSANKQQIDFEEILAVREPTRANTTLASNEGG